jgi:hypothetical protein
MFESVFPKFVSFRRTSGSSLEIKDAFLVVAKGPIAIPFLISMSNVAMAANVFHQNADQFDPGKSSENTV